MICCKSDVANPIIVPKRDFVKRKFAKRAEKKEALDKFGERVYNKVEILMDKECDGMTDAVIAQAQTLFGQAPDRIPLLCVVGPTASGKSRLAVELAQKTGGEVVSCDSMQVYRRMNIGTAKPTEAEMEGIPHHMIDVVDPEVPYSCAEYVAAAREVLADLHARGKLPILCGGTGLYLDRLLRGGSDASAASDPNVRAELAAYRAERGNAALHALLEQADPESAAAIHENNIPRVIRALEIFRVTGRTKTEVDRENAALDPTFCPYVVGLLWKREDLNRRIDVRVGQMLSAGLLDETRRLLAEGVFDVNATAAQAIGYKELLSYLHGEESLVAAVERLRLATRHYAKRQMTWFRAKDYVKWVEM